MKRTPPPKRKLENDFEDDETNNNDESNNLLAKKLNTTQEARKDLSIFDKNMFEAEYKSQFLKISNLEQELLNVKNEKKSLESEFNNFKRTKAEELRDIAESKKELEKSLKLCKTNENFLKSENERLCKVAEEAEATRLPDKEKEVHSLQNIIDSLLEEKQANESKFEREIENLKYDLKSKKDEIEQIESDFIRIKENLSETNLKFDLVRKENSQLQNRIKDLESDQSKKQDDTDHLSKYIDQSVKIENLERENRNLLADLEYSK
jgi:hypothetical protein